MRRHWLRLAICLVCVGVFAVAVWHSGSQPDLFGRGESHRQHSYSVVELHPDGSMTEVGRLVLSHEMRTDTPCLLGDHDRLAEIARQILAEQEL